MKITRRLTHAEYNWAADVHAKTGETCGNLLPSLARNETDLALSVRVHPSGLSPRFIRCIDDMEDVTKEEAQRLAQEPAVLRLIIVEDSPVEEHDAEVSERAQSKVGLLGATS
ncbi:hypothetical protein NDU88_000536 [Pleurodeles waltl]|uniref:Uncharacterized protein n=1 Tax=Pleurodeles waltl TaxID=8319 RepID=A0AAV7KP62_PLEWA|nr:hypothetical protein NDU88_000536 [Pleurodeles waltl]